MSTTVMVNGLPGNMAKEVTRTVLDRGHELIPFSLTGAAVEAESSELDSVEISLVKPDKALEQLCRLRELHPQMLAVDYTHPYAVNDNALLYIQAKIPFVMGTTGGDRNKLLADVNQADLPCVIAPNMAKPIVAFQNMMQNMGKSFPGAFCDYKLEVKESHQAGKVDTSGTAKVVVASFRELGLDFEVEEILQERDPKIQREDWGIPEKHIGGHAFHTYSLRSPEGSTLLEFRHNVLGRRIYAEGTVDAVEFLAARIASGLSCGRFDMIDVLHAGAMS